MNRFSTRHVGLASFLLYVLGDDSLSSVTQGHSGCVVAFDDPEQRSHELQSAFLSAEGVCIGNAMPLLECSRTIRHAISVANRMSTWTKEMVKENE